ncbi:MAG: UMP kinase [Planctomycetota bacterium]|nr:UMP kinase [Planctomycetota bacterium]
MKSCSQRSVPKPAARPRFSRILLKLSGEAFCKPEEGGIDKNEAAYIAREIIAVHALGVQTAIVVGGGNLIRGSRVCGDGVGPAAADYMGMLATVINALLLQEILERHGAVTRVMSALTVQSVAEPFIRRRCMRHLEKGRIVILAGGTGNPHFTTDTAAALRAKEIGAEIILKATKVDGVYSSDPAKGRATTRYSRLSFGQVLEKGLRIMDATAITMCEENNVPIFVFNLKRPGNILKAVCGKSVGTLIAGSAPRI